MAGMVGDGYRLADIGTDHAYIPIWLVSQGRIPGAVAMDVNEGPLKRARDNIRLNGLGDRIGTRLSDGFAALQPGEAEAAVIAGMGGGLTIRILREGAAVVRLLKECVLQPQSEIDKVRTFLLEEGFSFIKEDMVEEDGKYYPMMCVRPPSSSDRVSGCPAVGSGSGYGGAGEKWTDEELLYGRLLLSERHPVLREYLEREIRIKSGIIRSLADSGSDRAGERIRELKKELECAEKGLGYYALQ